MGLISGKIVTSGIVSNVTLTGKNNWNLTYNNNTGAFIIYKAVGTMEEEIMDIQYTVGSEGKTGSVTISEIKTTKFTSTDYISERLENITKLVTKKELTGISITTPPTKVKYIQGENFNKAGMVVTATYNDGNSQNVTNSCTILDGNGLTKNKTSVTIEYTEDGITKQAIQTIQVTEKLEIDVGDLNIKEENNIKYINDILPGTKINNVTGQIETTGTVKIYKGETQITDKNAKIGTGMKIVIEGEENQKQEYIVVVKGDLTGDGEMDDIDLLKLARYKAGLDTNLNGAYLMASDLYARDNEYASDIDLLKFVRILVGLDNF